MIKKKGSNPGYIMTRFHAMNGSRRIERKNPYLFLSAAFKKND